MRFPGSLAAGALLLSCTVVVHTGCKKEEPAGTSQTIRFRNVPLLVDVPSDWSQSLNTAKWVMYRPDSGGALLAMSGDQNCSTVEKRVFSALLEIGLTEVTWQGAPRRTDIHGLRATVAKGVAVEGAERSRVQYAIVETPQRQGCLLSLVAVWESRAADHAHAADAILRSVHAED